MSLTIGTGAACYTRDPEARAAFAVRHWVRLPGLLDELLLRTLDARLSSGDFREIRHDAVASETVDLRVIGAAASELLVLLCNDPVVIRAVEDIAGCTGLTRFNGSIYRLLPEARHQQAWHDDLVDGRAATLSVNIGSADYDGGLLEIRDRATQRIVARVPNTGRGDGVLFRLHDALEHRVTPVTRGVKTAFAGWFRHGTPLREELRGAAVLR
jgi:hypothetical protein